MARNGALQLSRQILRVVADSHGFDRVAAKVSVVTAEPGRVKFEMPVCEEHSNKGGTLHGGMTATLIDMMTTVALMTTERAVPGVSVDMNITYMKAAFPGETITIDAKVLKAGKTLGFTTCDITNEKGALVAQARHTKFIGSS
ncbi:acyl-coenzyme A thioesterase 13-like [Glandiceps talaboti]